MADNSFEEKFKQDLYKKYEICKRNLLPKDEYNKTIEDLKAAGEATTKKDRQSYYHLSK